MVLYRDRSCATSLGYLAFDSGISLISNPNFPWFWKNLLAAVFYMSLGGLYEKYEEIVDKKIGLKNWWVMAFFVIAYSCYRIFDFSAYNGGLDCTPITIGSALLSIVGIMIMGSICEKISSTEFSDYWGILLDFTLCAAIPNTLAVVWGK